MPTLAIVRYLQGYMILMLAAFPHSRSGLAKKRKVVSKTFLYETNLPLNSRVNPNTLHKLKIGSLGEVPADQSIRGFISTPLPGAVRISKVSLHPKLFLQPSMQGNAHYHCPAWWIDEPVGAIG
jgi:hypothetical protein